MRRTERPTLEGHFMESGYRDKQPAVQDLLSSNIRENAGSSYNPYSPTEDEAWEHAVTCIANSTVEGGSRQGYT